MNGSYKLSIGLTLAPQSSPTNPEVPLAQLPTLSII